MNSSLYTKCELIFWDVTIDLLTRSVWLRNLIRTLVAIKNTPHLKTYLSIVIFSGVFGFFVGFSVPYLLQFLW
ncbi:MAG: hypothetical protein AB1522_00370 [Chloroflexota bacterium]